ncbi:MAG: hypothetical protein M1817_001791 [Caeruleum heppii]|nr:MAG: hypothetical protein M1817_001791 [Caeruleum heppii]
MSQPGRAQGNRHPLQRLAAPSRGFSAFVHVSGIASFVASFKYLVDYPTIINDSYGWHMQYLTIIGLSLATLTFSTGFLADLSLSPRLFKVKNGLLVTSAPLEILISVLYWSLRLIDKRLVLPDWAELSPVADVGFHAAPALFLLVDLLLLSPPWTITSLPALGLSSIIAFVYWWWVEECYKHNGWYPYPIFELVTPVYRVGLFVMSAVVMAGSTATLKWLYGRINGVEKARVERAGERQQPR